MEMDNFEGDLPSVGCVKLDIKLAVNLQVFSARRPCIELLWLRRVRNEEFTKLVSIISVKDKNFTIWIAIWKLRKLEDFMMLGDNLCRFRGG